MEADAVRQRWSAVEERNSAGEVDDADAVADLVGDDRDEKAFRAEEMAAAGRSLPRFRFPRTMESKSVICVAVEGGADVLGAAGGVTSRSLMNSLKAEQNPVCICGVRSN